MDRHPGPTSYQTKNTSFIFTISVERLNPYWFATGEYTAVYWQCVHGCKLSLKNYFNKINILGAYMVNCLAKTNHC